MYKVVPLYMKFFPFHQNLIDFINILVLFQPMMHKRIMINQK